MEPLLAVSQVIYGANGALSNFQVYLAKAFSKQDNNPLLAHDAVNRITRINVVVHVIAGSVQCDRILRSPVWSVCARNQDF